MLIENRKITLIITLTVIALLIDMIMVVDFIFSVYKLDFYGRFLYEVRFFFWGWFLALVFAGTAIGTTLYWKPSRVLFRGIVILLSVVAMILALLWLFGLIMISTLEF